jgi:hypothetical protein
MSVHQVVVRASGSWARGNVRAGPATIANVLAGAHAPGVMRVQVKGS